MIKMQDSFMIDVTREEAEKIMSDWDISIPHTDSATYMLEIRGRSAMVFLHVYDRESMWEIDLTERRTMISGYGSADLWTEYGVD